MLISKSDSCLLIIDVQERLAPAANDPARLINGCSKLLRGAGILNIPAVVTEQYPKGLGPSIFDIRDAAPENTVYFPKTSLSAMGQEGFAETMAGLGRKQVVVAGIEEHVCVLQTAVELKEAGYDVFVVTDASASRTVDSENAARERFRQEGIALVTVEMVLFEWLRKAGSPEFKEIQNKLIR